MVASVRLVGTVAVLSVVVAYETVKHTINKTKYKMFCRLLQTAIKQENKLILLSKNHPLMNCYNCYTILRHHKVVTWIRLCRSFIKKLVNKIPDIMNTVAVELSPLNTHCPYASLSMYSLRLNCSISSPLLLAIIGIVAVAIVAPTENEALYLPGVKSSPAVIK